MIKITIKAFGPKLQSELRIEKDDEGSRQIFVDDDFWRLEPLKKFFLQNPEVAEYAWQKAGQDDLSLDKSAPEP